MKKYIPILAKTRLFSGIKEDEIESMLSCLSARLCTYKKGEYVISRGDLPKGIALLLEGDLLIQSDDYWGNRSILSAVRAGEMFGEAYAASEGETMMNDVVAAEDSAVMFFDMEKILTVCSSACRFHSMAVKNLFSAISEKNRKLVKKLGYMSRRTTREKLISYLSDEAGRQKSSSFAIPFNRQQLADYLCVDRSAMSNELCKMRDEGLIKFEKNKFELME